ncbi:MAG: hypothetical protein CMH52_13565 [Myxococcales bacterium]|nr:hypothetical protein [Myxococcales bacterium]|tara:strand:+ start:496 stop:981 length:486 start_codon:yes stop_codon:yes gene_type:complete
MGDYAAIVERLQLVAHPEGGFYKETYRASLTVDYDGASRSASTAIYYLLHGDAISRLHRIDADEGWHWHAGVGLRVHVFDESGYRALDLGMDLDAGQAPQRMVPAGAWFGAEVIGGQGYALVSCTVAPGFEFSRFELAHRDTALADWPEHQAIINRLLPRH